MNDSKLQPLHDKIIIRRSAAVEKTPGGLIVPDTAKTRPHEGTVIAVGRGKTLSNGKLVEPSVKPGDRVLFVQHAGIDLPHFGADLLVVREEDIFAVVEA